MSDRATDAVLAERLRPFVPGLHLEWLDQHPTERWRTFDGSLLYSDVSGFTAMSERLSLLGKRGAEETNELINDVMGGMVADCEQEGGEVLVFAGDAIICAFLGAGHGSRAGRSALAIRDTVTGRHRTESGVSAMLRVSSGIHSGEIMLARAPVGLDKLMILGPATSAVCAAESTATAGQVLLSAGAVKQIDSRLIADDPSGPLLKRRPREVDGARSHLQRGSRSAVLRALPEDRWDLLSIDRPGEHRPVAAAFIEFSGVDRALGELGPEGVVDALDALCAVVAEQSAIHSVHVLDTDVAPDGGRFFLTAGAPTSTESDEENLVRATLGVLGHTGPLALRAGVNRGRVFAGVIGGPTRRAYTCLGDAINLAARLCARAPSGSLLASKDLLDRVYVPVNAVELEPIMVKGKSHPIQCAVVSSIGNRSDARSTVFDDVPLVGRADELGRLRELERAARRGRGATVVLRGEAGTGKSRIAKELTNASELPTVWVNAEPYLATTPYSAIRGVLRPLLGLSLTATDQEVAARLGELEAATQGFTGLMPLVARALGAELPITPEVADIAPAFLSSTLQRALVAVLEASRPQPTIVVLDDAQWADDTSLELLAGLASFARASGWLFVVGTRDSWTSDEVETIKLSALADAEAAELITRLVGSTLTVHDRRTLQTRGGGNPLFLIELGREALRTGSASDLPESIESLLMARIDQLAPSQRVLLRDASVLGTTVDVGLLVTALDDPSAGDPARWAPLSSFVEPDGSGYRFVSALGQQAAYEGLPFRRRRWVHLRVGEALERESDPARHVATMALHFAAAGDHQRGWRYGTAAGEQAAAAFANADAADSFALALREASFLRGLEPQALADVEERFGDVCDVLGKFDEAAALYRRARRRAPAPRQLRKIGLMHERVGAYDKSIAWLRRGEHELRQATTAEEIAERALVRASRAGLCYRVGDLFGALDFGVKAATDAQTAGDPHVLAKATLLLELVTSQLGFVGKSVELFHQSGDLNGEADARNNRGMAAYFRGDWETALAEYEASGELFARTGDVVGAATSLNNIGEILSDQGHYAAALAKFEEARQEFTAANYAMGVTVVLGNVARAEARAGNHDKALELFDTAIGRFREMDSGAFALDQQIRRLECLLLAGRFDDAAAQERVVVETLQAGSPDAHALAVAFRLRGWLAYAKGDLATAASLLAQSLAEASIADARYERAVALLTAAEVERARGGDPAPLREEAMTLLDELGVISVPGWLPNR